jgi:acyl carrier protein
MSISVEERVTQIISNIMNIPITKISVDSSSESVEQWESMKHIQLILALEEEFDVQFDDEQIAELQSVSLIVAAIEKANK